jgi:anti-sigma B factor antagonist
VGQTVARASSAGIRSRSSRSREATPCCTAANGPHEDRVLTVVWNTVSMDSAQARVEVTPTDDGWSISGEIDASTAPIVAEATATLPASSSSTGRVVVAVSQVSFIDSSGLRVLVDLSERAGEVGARVVVSDPSRSVSRLLTITGLDDVFILEPAR